MEFLAILWLVLFIAFLVVEASTVTLVSVWFAVGALVSLVVSLFRGPIWLQVVLFFLVSGVLLLLLRPVLRKYFNPKLQKTNADAVVGTTGIVTEDIDNIRSKGQVKLGAMTWSARSSTGESIAAGTLVVADRIEGVKVFVTPQK